MIFDDEDRGAGVKSGGALQRGTEYFALSGAAGDGVDGIPEWLHLGIAFRGPPFAGAERKVDLFAEGLERRPQRLAHVLNPRSQNPGRLGFDPAFQTITH